MTDVVTLVMGITKLLWPISSKLLLLGPVLPWLHSLSTILFQITLFPAILISFILLFSTLIVIFLPDREKEKSFDSKKAPSVSIHLPTRNELAVIQCAERCLQFDYPADKIQILIGDDSDKPAISEKLKEFEARHFPKVQVLKREKNIGFKAGNLNNLLKYSTGDIIVVFDSDFAPRADFLQRLIAPFQQDSELAATQARWRPSNSEQSFSSVLATNIVNTCHFVSLPFLKRVFGTVTLCGSAEAVRRNKLIALGGWKGGSFTEDVEFSFRLFQNRERVQYISTLECDCEVPFTVRDLNRQQMRWAYGIISALKEHALKTIRSRNIGLRQKLPVLLTGGGYVFTLLLLFVCATGTLSSITMVQYPTYETTAFALQALGKNVLWTIGLLVANLYAVIAAGKLGQALKMVLASFSIGFLVVWHVNQGVWNALQNKPMNWFLVAKNRNQAI